MSNHLQLRVMAPKALFLVCLLGLTTCPAASPSSEELQKALDSQRNFNAVQIVYRGGVPHTDARGRLMTEYDSERSFFSIGIWGTPAVSAELGAQLKDAGFNTIWPWHVPIEPALKAGEESDLQVVVMYKISDDDLKNFKDHPRLLANLIDEEMTGQYYGRPEMQIKYDAFLAYREKVHHSNPGLPVFNVDCSWIMEPATTWWVKWNTAADISCHDNYPILYRPQRVRSIGAEPMGIPQTTALAAAINKEQKPVWLVLPANEQPHRSVYAMRFATPTQLRSMVYTAIIHGATGICYFTLDHPISRNPGFVGISPDPKVTYGGKQWTGKERGRDIAATPMQLVQSKALWEAAKYIHRELHELTPIMLSPTIGPEVSYTVAIKGESVTATPIRCLLKPHPGGGYVLLSVNTDDATLDVTYRFPNPLAEAGTMFENRPPTELAEDGKSFSIVYEAFDTHVIRVKKR